MVRKTIPKKVEKAVKDYTEELKKDGLLIRKLILYGSYAKKKAHKWSDVDICIISPNFKNKDPLEYLWLKKTNRDVEAMIAPVGFHPKDFIDESPLAYEIKRTGIEIKV
jgi:predicted nucleotidyltransferase